MAKAQPDQEERERYQDALSSLTTRRVLWDLLEAGGIYRTSLVIGAPDASAFNEGRRSLALELLTKIERFAPGSLEQMKAEAAYELEHPEVTRGRRRRSPAARTGPGPASGSVSRTGTDPGTSSPPSDTEPDPYASADPDADDDGYDDRWIPTGDGDE
jgi:hypothetical protein